MEKLTQKVLVVLLPFYPLWGWAFTSLTHKNINNYINLLWIPIVFYYLLTKNNKLPRYLLFLILFTIYHLSSVYLNGLVRSDSNLLAYFLTDSNVLACALLFIIANTDFDDGFITLMNRNVFLVIVLSLIVSVIQIKNPSFFLSPATFNTENAIYIDQSRNFSIFSWIGLNSLGISFPILVSLLLSSFDIKEKKFPLIVLSGIIVSFLTRARYVMISTLLVFSQLLINAKITIRNKLISVSVFIISIVFLITIAEKTGFDLQQVIDERILEKEGDMGSAKSRLTSYYVFLIKFPENPWFGVGPETRDDVVRLLGGEAPLIHIGYLSYLYFYGLFGFLLLSASIFYLLKEAFIVGRKFLFWGSFYGLLSFCFANTTFVYFNFSEMGIVLAVIYMKYYNDRYEFSENEKILLV